MKGKKLSYRELLNKCEKLEKKIKSLEEANLIADRHPINYDLERWIAIPLHPKQSELAREYFMEKLRYDDFKKVGDEKHYEEIHESEFLPNHALYLVRYSTDLQGNHIDAIRVWGLTPIRMY